MTAELRAFAVPQGEVLIGPPHDGRRTVRLVPTDPELFIPVRECSTQLAEETIVALASIQLSHCGVLIDEFDRPEANMAPIRRQLFGYFETADFVGARILDYGCGNGASSVILGTLLPQATVLGISESEVRLRPGRLVLADRGLNNVEFRVHPYEDPLPVLGTFDFVVMNAVYEHLLPAERQRTLAAAWRMLKSGGALLVNQTHHSWLPYEHHSTGLWGVNYLPDALAHWYVRRFSKINPKINTSTDWSAHLRGGVRGASEREVLRYLRKASDAGTPVVQQPRSGDRASYWLESVRGGRFLAVKTVITMLFRALDRTFGVVPSTNLDMVIRKCV